MNIKKTLAGIASYALVGAVAAGVAGTWAGLQEETYAANMMTTPGLDVVMHETQRNADKTGFEKFDQCQEILPSTFAKEGVEFAWAPENEWITPSDYVAPTGADGNEWRVFDSNMQNVVDKFVTVENKGKSDAYVRTIIAYECPEGISDEYLRVNDNSARTGVISNEVLGDGKLVEINGTTYWVSTYTYKEALGKGETTIPSLKQVFLRSNATTEICEAFGDTIDILVISQAAQVGDYTDATTALDAAFGDVNEENVKAWFGQYSMPTIVESQDELDAAIAQGGTVYLNEGTYTLPSALNNTTLVGGDGGVTVCLTAKGSSDKNDLVTLGDNVKIENVNFVLSEDSGVGTEAAAVLKVAGQNVVIDGCTFDITGTNSSAIEIGGGSANTVVKNCTFTGGYKHISPGSGTPGDITFENCTFGGTKSTYAVHLNVTSNDVLFKNCELPLFNTFYGTETSTGTLTFDNCDFTVVPGKTNVVKLYRSATFNDCDFEEGYLFSGSGNDKHDFTVVTNGGSWADETIKDHFLADTFSNVVTCVFDGETYIYNYDPATKTGEWVKQ